MSEKILKRLEAGQTEFRDEDTLVLFGMNLQDSLPYFKELKDQGIIDFKKFIPDNVSGFIRAKLLD